MNSNMQSRFPEWWSSLEISARTREKILSQFTITRDGYARWYKGAPRFVCGKKVDPNAVEARWRDKVRGIDGGRPATHVVDEGQITVRDAMSRFFEHQRTRIDAPKNKISQRTFHNYESLLNKFGSFVVFGEKIADMWLSDIGPEQFSAFAATMAKWKPSGFDSVVTRIGAFFNWCVDMEFIDRYRPGPAFIRPAKKDIREDRLGKKLSLSAEDAAKCYVAASHTMRCWVALGICAAFNNSDIANLPRDPAVVNLAAGVIDFNRRKTGQVRRIIPLPDDVLDLIRGYVRPAAKHAPDDGLFFLTEGGLSYSQTRNRNGNPSCSISRLTARLMTTAGVKRPGVNFKSFRTTFYNLAPKSGYEVERMIVMGRAQGTIDFDSYLEGIELDRVRHVVNHVWYQIKIEIQKLNTAPPGQAAAMAASGGGSLEAVRAKADSSKSLSRRPASRR